MHHPQATHAAAVAIAHIVGQQVARFVSVVAVQIELALQGPVAPPQFVDHVGPDARAAKTQAVVGQQQAFKRDLVGQRFGQGSGLVELSLPRVGQGAWQVQFGQLTIRQAVYRAHGAGKQVGAGLLLAGQGTLGSQFLRDALGGFSGLALHGFTQLTQVRQAGNRSGGPPALVVWRTQSNPRSAKLTTWPWPTTR